MTAMLPALKKAARKGRDGDTMIAHINEAEAAALRAMGGSGTRNPRTGLLEFGGGGGTINGAGGSGNVSGGGRGNTASGEGRGNNPGKGVDRVNSGLGQTHQSWGNRMETPYGAPYRTTPYGTVALPEDRWNAWKDQVDKYNEAANKWNAGTGRSFANFVNRMSPMGFSMQQPDINRPATYVGGDYHLGWNPGSLAGLASPVPGGGIVLGALGEKIYTGLGGKDLMIGGGQVPTGWDANGAAPANTGAPAAAASSGLGSNSGGGNGATVGGLLPPIAGAPTPRPAAPAAAPAVPGAPVAPTTMVPGGYQPISGPTPYGWTRPSWTF